MKSCPTCNRTYPDDTLAFCLVDGSVLSAAFDSEQTLRIPAPRPTAPPATELLREPTRTSEMSTIHAPAPNVPALGASDIRPEEISESRGPNLLPWLLISAAILVVGIFAAWMVISRWPVAATSSSNRPTPLPSNTVDSKLETICGREVDAAIFRKWTEMGGESGALGCPVNHETEAPVSPRGSIGRWIQFAKGDGGYLIVYKRRPDDGLNQKPVPLAGQAFEVSGCMFKVYASLGGTKSWLGFPVSDGRQTSTGARQDFEDGFIVWDSKTYQCQAHRPD